MQPVTKECQRCWETLPIDKFPMRKPKGKKKGGPESYCLPCHHVMDKERNSERIARMSESGFQKEVIRMAHEAGWMVAHFKAAIMPSGKWATPVQADGKGFPDMLMVKEPFDLVGFNTKLAEVRKWMKENKELFNFDAQPPMMKHVIAAELKADGGDLRDEQIKWLLAFSAAGIPSYAWTPSDLDDIEVILKTGAEPVATYPRPQSADKEPEHVPWTAPVAKVRIRNGELRREAGVND